MEWELRIYHYGKVVERHEGLTRAQCLAEWAALQSRDNIAPIAVVDGVELKYWQAETLWAHPRMTVERVLTMAPPVRWYRPLLTSAERERRRKESKKRYNMIYNERKKEEAGT